MWYGKHAPAPASKVHPLYQKPSPSKRMPLQKFQWAPLEEPARRRRDEWKRQQALARASRAGTMSRNFSLPEIGSGRGMQMLGPQDASRPGSSGSQEGMSVTASGHKLKKKVSMRFNSSMGSEHSLRTASRPSDSDGSSEQSSDAGEEPLQPVSVVRRVSLVDRLLEARLAEAPERARTLLLAGRKFDRTSSGIGNAFRGAYKDGEKAPMRERAEAMWGVLAKCSEISLGAPLAEAFLVLDVPYPQDEVLTPLLQRQLHGRSSADKEDFLKLVTMYEDTVQVKLETAFKEQSSYDETLAAAQVPRVLEEADLTLMPGARADLLKALDAEGKSSIKLSEFVNIHEDVSSRAGLTDRVYFDISEAFEAREKADGTISVGELIEILSWNENLVALAGPEMVQKIAYMTARRAMEGRININIKGWVKEMAATPPPDAATVAELLSARITGSAVLAAARVLHDRIAAGMTEVMMRVGARGSVVTLGKVLAVIEEIGYFGVTLEGVEHFVEVCGFGSGAVALDFDQLYTLILKFVQHNGFTLTEEADLADIFKKFDADGSGTLETSELGPVVRWLGYQPTQYRIYSFAVDFGLEDDSQLDLRQFRKMVANYHKLSLRRVREVFVTGRMPNTESQIRVSEIGTLLAMVGYEPTVAEVATVVEILGGPDVKLDFMMFKRVEISHRRHVRKTMEENGGVTNAEYKKYQSYFHENQNGDGFITQKAMRTLLGKLFPCSILDRARHVRIAQMVRDADFDGNGLFDFKEFVWLMNRVTEDMDRDNLIKGLQLKKTLGYSSAEVKQFKDLYSLSDEDMSGTIDIGELATLLSTLVPIEREARHELNRRFEEVCTPGNTELDFWEFLTIMRNIQRDNWLNINGVVGRRGSFC